MKRYTNEDNQKDRNRFKLLMEYDFYIGEDDELDDEENIEGDEAELDAEPEMDDSLEGGDDEFGDAEPTDDEFGGEPEGELDSEPEMEEPLPEPEPMEDEIELDVTELVQGTDAAKASADQANAKADMLLSKLDNLTQSLERMAAINAKIEDLENEIEKRNPTPEEKLEMRSLDSYPYSMKLTDFWAEKEGHYDAMGGNVSKNEDGEKEYVLTQDEVDRDYNAQEIKDSLRGAEDYKYNKNF
jgi:hypothetical protein